MNRQKSQAIKCNPPTESGDKFPKRQTSLSLQLLSKIFWDQYSENLFIFYSNFWNHVVLMFGFLFLTPSLLLVQGNRPLHKKTAPMEPLFCSQSMQRNRILWRDDALLAKESSGDDWTQTCFVLFIWMALSRDIDHVATIVSWWSLWSK